MNNIAILAVDDERIILDSIRIQLEKNFNAKYLLEFAESADEALEIVDSLTSGGVNILLVISDYLMPGMKGDEFANILKNKFPKINIVMLTGQITSDVSTKLIDKNIILKLISKPWQENDLINVVNSLSIYEN
ncbi:MAG: response regulator [Bacteroidia bacterium]|jgi:CheY-like chemotaxis protein|nr:response regulator [Bacteroidia bacterium]